MSLRDLDIGSMVVHILESGVTLRQLAERLESGYLSEKLLKHYMAGGMPNFPRGNVIVAMWCEATGLAESDAPMRDWSPAHRTDFNQTQTLRPRCEACLQIIRGQALLAWEQKQLFAAGEVTPSWLSPKPLAHEHDENQRSIRLNDDEEESEAP